MELDVLRKIGLTEGEIKVYRSLLSLGKTSTGEIMKKSNISSSKVYLILDKLIKKGLVSFILEDNVKKFQATNPKTILDYIDSQKEELEDMKEDVKKIIPKIANSLNNISQESAQVYKGIKGIKVAYNNILDELKKGEEYLIFTSSLEEVHDEQVLLFFQEFHKKRAFKGIRIRAIADEGVYSIYKKRDILGKLCSLKYSRLIMPTGIVIGKNRILIITFGEENTAYEIVSQKLVKKYEEFFNNIWKNART